MWQKCTTPAVHLHTAASTNQFATWLTTNQWVVTTYQTPAQTQRSGCSCCQSSRSGCSCCGGTSLEQFPNIKKPIPPAGQVPAHTHRQSARHNIIAHQTRLCISHPPPCSAAAACAALGLAYGPLRWCLVAWSSAYTAAAAAARTAV
jgi:hypothetical protein